MSIRKYAWNINQNVPFVYHHLYESERWCRKPQCTWTSEFSMFLWKEDDDAPQVDARHLFQTYLSATFMSKRLKANIWLFGVSVPWFSNQCCQDEYRLGFADLMPPWWRNLIAVERCMWLPPSRFLLKSNKRESQMLPKHCSHGWSSFVMQSFSGAQPWGYCQMGGQRSLPGRKFPFRRLAHWAIEHCSDHYVFVYNFKQEYLGFVIAIGDAVKGKKLTDEVKVLR